MDNPNYNHRKHRTHERTHGVSLPVRLFVNAKVCDLGTGRNACAAAPFAFSLDAVVSVLHKNSAVFPAGKEDGNMPSVSDLSSKTSVAV